MVIESRVQDITQEVAAKELQSGTVERQGSVTSKSNSGTTRKSKESETKASVGTKNGSLNSALEPIDVHRAVEKLNQIAESQMKDVSFSVDEDADATVIKVFKRKTGELIKQFPAEMILAMKARIRKNTGWFYDSKI
ncbi:MAG: flagellar protein FlaG [Candidatus Latescibacteria bacterium]|nr:flagellar protein FlaG [Candidatus Latescibacterota bacterium]